MLFSRNDHHPKLFMALWWRSDAIILSIRSSTTAWLHFASVWGQEYICRLLIFASNYAKGFLSWYLILLILKTTCNHKHSSLGLSYIFIEFGISVQCSWSGNFKHSSISNNFPLQEHWTEMPNSMTIKERS